MMNAVKDWRPFQTTNQALVMLMTFTPTARWPGTVVQQRQENTATDHPPKRNLLQSLRQSSPTKAFLRPPMHRALSPVRIPHHPRRGKRENSPQTRPALRKRVVRANWTSRTCSEMSSSSLTTTKIASPITITSSSTTQGASSTQRSSRLPSSLIRYCMRLWDLQPSTIRCANRVARFRISCITTTDPSPCYENLCKVARKTQTRLC